jgi:hypothetical protein
MGFAPGAPTAVTASLPATYGNTTALVSWTAPFLLGSPALHDYIVQYSADAGSTFTTFSDTVSATTSVTVTGLNNGTAYVFRVAAKNNIGTGIYSSNSNSVTPLFGKIATPVIGDIAETTSSIPWCYTNYASQSQDNGYVYNYYDYNAALSDTNGSCHGWNGLGENVNRYTYVYLSKAGWANSDSIYIEETTNVTPACTAYGTYIGVVCVGYDLYDQYHNGACGTYEVGPIESNSVEGCGYVAPTNPPCTTPCSCVCCDPQNQCGFDWKSPSSGTCGDGSFCYTYP